jgi:hypothetical protein
VKPGCKPMSSRSKIGVQSLAALAMGEHLR